MKNSNGDLQEPVMKDGAKNSWKQACRKCGGPLTLTGTKMNPATHGKYRSGKVVKAREGSDELVTCEACGWTWWVHRAPRAASPGAGSGPPR